MAEHIRIGDVAPRVQYAADGAQNAFTYPFPIFEVEDLDECDAVADLDGLRRVVDRPADQSDLLVVAEEIFYKALFI